MAGLPGQKRHLLQQSGALHVPRDEDVADPTFREIPFQSLVCCVRLHARPDEVSTPHLALYLRCPGERDDHQQAGRQKHQAGALDQAARRVGQHPGGGVQERRRDRPLRACRAPIPAHQFGANGALKKDIEDEDDSHRKGDEQKEARHDVGFRRETRDEKSDQGGERGEEDGVADALQGRPQRLLGRLARGALFGEATPKDHGVVDGRAEQDRKSNQMEEGETDAEKSASPEGPDRGGPEDREHQHQLSHAAEQGPHAQAVHEENAETQNESVLL
jgi:hypothetical protein